MPAPEMTPGRALLCLRLPETIETQGFSEKRKYTVILSKLPCIGGHRVYDGSESNTLKHIEKTTFLRHGRTGFSIN